ncbi:hypothetical protein AAZX31_13G017100 [Glycine max]
MTPPPPNPKLIPFPHCQNHLHPHRCHRLTHAFPPHPAIIVALLTPPAPDTDTALTEDEVERVLEDRLSTNPHDTDTRHAQAFLVPFFSSLNFNMRDHTMKDPAMQIDRQLQRKRMRDGKVGKFEISDLGVRIWLGYLKMVGFWVGGGGCLLQVHTLLNVTATLKLVVERTSTFSPRPAQCHKLHCHLVPSTVTLIVCHKLCHRSTLPRS